jgi:hypothetical protein
VAQAITLIFVGEMGLKLLALSCQGYWADRWNALDGAIVTVSLCDLGLTLLGTKTNINFSFLRILRMLRVLRVLRLMRTWNELYRIIVTFGKVRCALSIPRRLGCPTLAVCSLLAGPVLTQMPIDRDSPPQAIAQMTNLFVLYALFIFIFSLFGMQVRP